MTSLLPTLAAAAWMNGAIAGSVVGALVGLGLWAMKKKSRSRAAAADTATDAGLTVDADRSDEFPPELDGVAIVRAGRAHRVTAVARAERGIHHITTFGLVFQSGPRHMPVTHRCIAVHLPRSGTDPLRAVSLPDDAPEGILESFGHQNVDAPRTVRATDPAEAAEWASKTTLLSAAGPDAMLETGPAGLTFVAPGDPADAAELAHAIERALVAAD